MQSIWKIMAVLTLAGFTAAGCTSIDEVSQMKPKGGAYEKGLYSGYMKLAKGEYDEDDIADAEWFAQRAKAAASGKPTGPQELSERRLKSTHAKELGPARARLWSALDKGAAKKAGKHAAAAQVAFDCWIQEAEEDIKAQSKEVAKCKSDFYGAMALVEGALWKPAKAKAKKKMGPPRTKHFIAFFGLNSADLKGKSKKVVSDAVAFAKKNKSTEISVTGHTDKSGSQAYNKKLAKKRVGEVTKMFNAAGFNLKKHVVDVALGEVDPAVNTKDGMKEARNRRVVISITYR